MKSNNRKRGSLTIEAVISFSVFVSFMFMLLTMVKLSMVKITLDTAVSETAKHIAAASYPIGILNGAAEENNKDVKTEFTTDKTLQDLVKKDVSFGIGMIFADGDKSKEANTGAKGFADMFSFVGGLGVDAIETVIFPKVQTWIENHCYEMAAEIISDIIDNSYVGIDKSNLTLLMAKVPVTANGYSTSFNDAATLEKLGLSKNDFNKDDVVIGVEYNYKMALPFISTIDVKIRDVAVEHGWVNGGCGSINKSDEGIKLDSFINFYVYVTKTGKKYHREDCPYLWNSKIKKTKSNAKIAGYKPCSKCSP